jgi:hypothetical protein
MSNSDSFIDEVTEELRREQMLAKLKRYGWIGVVAVLAIVGGASFSEFRKAQERGQAEALGDAVLNALDSTDAAVRVADLQAITPEAPRAAALLALITASEKIAADDLAGAITSLDAVALSQNIPEIYRQIAQFKALTLQSETLDAAARRQGFEALAGAGGSLSLLAQEQLALIDLQEGAADAAITAYQAILSDAGVTPDLQQRALQVIVALGGEPDLGGAALQAPDDTQSGAPTE